MLSNLHEDNDTATDSLRYRTRVRAELSHERETAATDSSYETVYESKPWNRPVWLCEVRPGLSGIESADEKVQHSYI